MATQAADVRDNKVVVLLSGREKSSLMARAKAADMSVSDFVRTATERFDAEAEIPAALQAEILRQVEQAKARVQDAVDGVERYMAERCEPDRDAIQTAVFAELEGANVDWDRFRTLLGLRR